MPDELDPKPGEEELDESAVADEAEDEAEEAEDEAEGDDEGEGEDESEDEGEDGAADGDAEPARPAARGRPDDRQRDARRSREDKLRRENEGLRRILETNTAGRAPDSAAQQREYEAEQAKLLQAATEREQLGEVGTVAKYWADRTNREVSNRLQYQQNQTFEREDRRDFRSLCRDDNIPASIRDFVEDKIAEARQNGNYMLTREALLNHRLGELARQKARNGGTKRQGDRGQRRIERQTVRPARAASDAGRPGRRKAESEWSTEDYERNLADRPLVSR